MLAREPAPLGCKARAQVIGLGIGDDGQAYLQTRLLRVLPELADWAGSLPDDLLRVSPVLTPAR